VTIESGWDRLALRLVPWLALLALFGLKPNRTRRAWWVLAPLLLEVVPAYTTMNSGVALSQLGQILLCSALASAALWLCAGLFPPARRLSAWLLAALVLAGFGLLAYLPLLGGPISDVGALLIVIGLGPLTLLAGFVLAGLVCRRRFGAVRFLLAHLLGVVVSFMILMLVLFIVMGDLHNLGRNPVIFFVGAIYGAVFWVMMLPFLILALANRFYRARLVALVGPRAASPPPDGGMIEDQAAERVLAVEMRERE